MKQRIAVLSVLAVLPWAGLNAQTTVETTFRVSATVSSVCSITASSLDFGAYNTAAASPNLGTTELRATCSPGQTYQIGLTEGTTAGATVNQRKMGSSGSSTLNYQLYSDSARSSIWGTTPGTDTVTGVGSGLAVSHTVYGSIPPTQGVPAAAYSDTITVRLYY